MPQQGSKARLENSPSAEFVALAERIVAQTAGRGQKSILILDLAPRREGPPGSSESTPFGSWLADQISAALAVSGYPTVDRAKLAEALRSKGLSPQDVFVLAKARDLASSLGAACFVTGTFVAFQRSIGITLRVHCGAGRHDAVPLTSTLTNVDELERHLGGPLESFRPADGVYWAGEDGVTAPKCNYCPNPPFSDEAVKQKVSGSLVLSAVVTTKGGVEQVQVIKGVGYGLDKSAVRGVKTWRFSPARDPEGNEVPVHVPIEVSFKLYVRP